ncbi:transcriptional regulator [Mycolicibacterium chubuense NBB4]|uniref:Transcriptional regulator n=1 Tax=Mycolicibacterium chubuense (strain NBB4) TaxID=710421 RepID=I4BKH2_MYCCN|nr:LysR family transcriptional regulator [Mycolicibacterium chubuense]AFM17779.1 transcriptional regulator [Mycolicibacterium chubuense NBB4]
MDIRRLQLLLALSRLGSMRAVAEEHHLTTSTVSQQIAALAREAGTQLIEPEGRRVRLTPAGRRLADHAVVILAAVESARLDLDADAEPAGTVRVGGFATGIRVSLLPIVAELARRFPKVEFVVSEYEPIEAFAMLTADDLDLALTYDYNLAPASPGAMLETVPLWSIRWGLGVPSAAARDTAGDAAALSDFAGHTWIINSRNTADEDAVRTLAALSGFTPRIAHQIDSLDLVEDLIVAGFGVGLLPLERPTGAGVTVLPLRDPEVVLTAYAVTRIGRATWPPLRAVLDRLRPAPGARLPEPRWPRPQAAPDSSPEPRQPLPLPPDE